MSRLDKLKNLLARVETRRVEPRLVAVSGGRAVASANTNVASNASAVTSPAAREAPIELTKKRVSVEDAIASPAPSSMPPPPMGGPETKLHSSLPPPARTPEPVVSGAPSSTVPPAANLPLAAQPAAHSVDAPPRSTTEVLPPVPARIAPSPALPFDSAVRVTSAPRVDAVKSFGELLDQSLALRPKSG